MAEHTVVCAALGYSLLIIFDDLIVINYYLLGYTGQCVYHES